MLRHLRRLKELHKRIDGVLHRVQLAVFGGALELERLLVDPRHSLIVAQQLEFGEDFSVYLASLSLLRARHGNQLDLRGGRGTDRGFGRLHAGDVRVVARLEPQLPHRAVDCREASALDVVTLPAGDRLRRFIEEYLGAVGRPEHIMQDPDAAVAAGRGAASEDLLAAAQLAAMLLGGWVLAVVEILHDPLAVLLIRIILLRSLFFFGQTQVDDLESVRRLHGVDLVVQERVGDGQQIFDRLGVSRPFRLLGHVAVRLDLQLERCLLRLIGPAEVDADDLELAFGQDLLRDVIHVFTGWSSRNLISLSVDVHGVQLAQLVGGLL